MPVDAIARPYSPQSRNTEPSPAEATDGVFGVFANLPVETLDLLIRTVPESTFRLMDASHGLEAFIIGTVLKPLHDHLGRSVNAVRRFIRAAIKHERTPAQIVQLSELLSAGSVSSKGKRLVEIGMVSMRAHNAMCSSMITFLSTPNIAVYAFELRFPLMSAEDLADRRRITGRSKVPVVGKTEWIHGKPVYMTGVDKVFLHFAALFKEGNIGGFLCEQHEHGCKPSHPLLLPANGRGAVSEYPDASPAGVHRVAAYDAGTIALSMKRFLSATTLSAVDSRARPGEHGVLYRAMFDREPTGPNVSPAFEAELARWPARQSAAAPGVPPNPAERPTCTLL